MLKSLQEIHPKPCTPMSRRIVTAGGGAHRLAKLFMDSLTVEVVPFKEMESLVSGLTFLHENKPKDEAGQSRKSAYLDRNSPNSTANGPLGLGITYQPFAGYNLPARSFRSCLMVLKWPGCLFNEAKVE